MAVTSSTTILRSSPTSSSNVSELLKLVKQLRDSESRLRTQLVEQKLLRESAAIVPSLEAEIASRKTETELVMARCRELEDENEKLVREREIIKNMFELERREKDLKIGELLLEIEEVIIQRFQGLIEASGKSNLIKNLSFRKTGSNNSNTAMAALKLPEGSSNNNGGSMKMKNHLRIHGVVHQTILRRRRNLNFSDLEYREYPNRR